MGTVPAQVDTRRAEPWSPRFSATARTIAETARSLGLEPPAFRSPPAVPGADRTLRRLAGGQCVVAVRARGRPYRDVVADLVEGVVAAQGMSPAEAQRARRRLLEALDEALPAGR